MQNKKQIRLKTVFASHWIEPKQAIKLRIAKQESPPKQKQKMQTLRQLSSANKIRYKTQEHKGRQVSFKKAVMDNILNQKTTLKMFPKRQSSVKNGNPYKFFLSYSRKISTQQPQDVQFNNKLQNLVSKGSISLKKSQLSQRRNTETIPSKQRSRPIKSQQSTRIKDNYQPSPWFMKDQVDFYAHF